uniref:Uncharacterized protein n=1 Tax=Anguilla anguilla TaxID=7936 RepID=A0A0E9S0G2_ANGAN
MNQAFNISARPCAEYITMARVLHRLPVFPSLICHS